MLLPIAFALGFLVGWRRAGVRDGDRLDRLQYGAVHGIVFTLGALVLLLVAQRLELL